MWQKAGILGILLVLLVSVSSFAVAQDESSAMQTLEEMGTDINGYGIPSSYLETWYFCSNMPVQTENEQLGIDVKLSVPVTAENEDLFDQRCVSENGDTIPASEITGLQHYKGLTREQLVFQNDLFLEFDLKYWGYFEQYVLALDEILAAETPPESLPSISDLKLNGFYWIQMQISENRDQLANENTWRYLAIMNYGQASFLLLPTGELIPVLTFCPTEDDIFEEFTESGNFSGKTSPGYLADETVYCGEDAEATPAIEYLAIPGINVSSYYNGMFVMHGWPDGILDELFEN